MEKQQLNNVKIKLRTDALSNWISINPVLNYGELAIVIDEDGNENIKVGNGISAFNDLKYLNQTVLKSDLIQAKDIQAKSITQGYNNKATPTSLATGIFTEAEGNFGVVHGIEAKVLSSDDYAFVFNGENLPGITNRYTSHGEGTFNINPVNGLSGIYVGDETLANQIYTRSQVNVLYDDAIGKIPLSVSQLSNDAGFQTSADVSALIDQQASKFILRTWTKGEQN